VKNYHFSNINIINNVNIFEENKRRQQQQKEQQEMLAR
jgi:hypothetical protein